MVSGMVIVLLASLILRKISVAILLFPLVWMLHVMFLIGLLWILSLVNLVFRDLQNIIGVVIMYLMIASPIGYTPEMVPQSMKMLLTLNPLAHFIVAYQDLIVFGRLPRPVDDPCAHDDVDLHLPDRRLLLCASEKDAHRLCLTKMAVEFEGVGKMYRLYKSRMDSFLDITSLGRVSPWWNPKIDNFWALRNVSFKLKAGSRLGIIGRNGAGKTTLLKLMTGNITPTEGHIQVQGEVQACWKPAPDFIRSSRVTRTSRHRSFRTASLARRSRPLSRRSPSLRSWATFWTSRSRPIPRACRRAWFSPLRQRSGPRF